MKFFKTFLGWSEKLTASRQLTRRVVLGVALLQLPGLALGVAGFMHVTKLSEMVLHVAMGVIQFTLMMFCFTLYFCIRPSED